MPHEPSRRRFLASLGEAGAALAAGSWLDAIGYAQARPRSARALDPAAAASAPTSIARLLGSFLEHLGRAIYTGVYQPGRPRRRQAASAPTWSARSRSSACRSSAIPGGNFVSGYNWLDGVGPEGAAADGARAGVELARDEPVRHQRLHRLVPPRRHRTAARDQFRHRHAGDGGGLCRILQPASAARSGATCAGRTATSSRTTCATGAWATRWTARGRSGRCRRASTAARRATRRSRCASSTAGCS